MFLIYLFRYILVVLILKPWSESLDYSHIFTNHSSDYLEARYGLFPEHLRLEMLDKAKEMFSFAYSNYIQLAFPKDELNPIHCCGRGRDHDDRSNININDILGDYSLTLVDSLNTLAIIGNVTQFQEAVSLLINHVNFDKDHVVQVFEVNIRLIGSLLSTHLLMRDESEPFGKLTPDWYEDQLLHLAHDLAARLLPAFENSSTGLPLPRVNLRYGVPTEPLTSETCPAGAGSLLLEMGILSRLLDDPVYEGYARRAIKALWSYRTKTTGLLGNVIDAASGEWIGRLSGLGAGLDSFYEYLLKSYIMFGQTEDYQMFHDIYKSIKTHMRRGRRHCNRGVGDHPVFVNVDMNTGETHTSWIDSLQAAFAGVQVLHGDIEEAICAHALYYLLWKSFGVLPERWNWRSMSADVPFYPLRPELIESTYLLYQATKSPFYLHVGQEILENLNKYTRTSCGYATVHSVLDMSLEDRMESFFLSETAKYLFLLFDTDNYINRNFDKYIFSTEGHIFPVDKRFREKSWSWSFDSSSNVPLSHYNISEPICESIDKNKRFFMPLKSKYLVQVGELLSINKY